MSATQRARKENSDLAPPSAPATVPPTVQVYDDGTNTFFWYVKRFAFRATYKYLCFGPPSPLPSFPSLPPSLPSPLPRRAHTITALVLIVTGLVYVALWDTPLDTMYNMRRGAVACVIIFVLIGVINMPDGPFVRPHPGR